jgi:hypothetical protein
VTNTLTFKSSQDRKQHTISVGSEGRFEAVMQSGHRPVGLEHAVAPNEAQRSQHYAMSDTSSQATSESAAPAIGATLPRGAGVVRRETYGRYDPLTHTLAFRAPRSEGEERVSVGAKGARCPFAPLPRARMDAAATDPPSCAQDGWPPWSAAAQ